MISKDLRKCIKKYTNFHVIRPFRSGLEVKQFIEMFSFFSINCLAIHFCGKSVIQLNFSFISDHEKLYNTWNFPMHAFKLKRSWNVHALHMIYADNFLKLLSATASQLINQSFNKIKEMAGNRKIWDRFSMVNHRDTDQILKCLKDFL